MIFKDNCVKCEYKKTNESGTPYCEPKCNISVKETGCIDYEDIKDFKNEKHISICRIILKMGTCSFCGEDRFSCEECPFGRNNSKSGNPCTNDHQSVTTSRARYFLNFKNRLETEKEVPDWKTLFEDQQIIYNSLSRENNHNFKEFWKKSVEFNNLEDKIKTNYDGKLSILKEELDLIAKKLV